MDDERVQQQIEVQCAGLMCDLNNILRHYYDTDECDCVTSEDFEELHYRWVMKALHEDMAMHNRIKK